jgi:hypothetical protein
LGDESVAQAHQRPAVLRIGFQIRSIDHLRFRGASGAQQHSAERVPHGLNPVRRFVVNQLVLAHHGFAQFGDRLIKLVVLGQHLAVEAQRGNGEEVGTSIVSSDVRGHVGRRNLQQCAPAPRLVCVGQRAVGAAARIMP